MSDSKSVLFMDLQRSCEKIVYICGKICCRVTQMLDVSQTQSA